MDGPEEQISGPAIGTSAAGAPGFPGGTSLSHLRVYDWPADDAPGGSGTPHLHTTSTEAYVVLGGSGRVETLSGAGYAQTPLAEGAVVWFSPGTVHRLVNEGDLEILVVMSNAGLPEAGDAVLTFPPDVLADVDRYRAAAALPSGDDDPDPDRDRDPDRDPAGAAALARRDLALDGYRALRDAVLTDGPAAMEPLWTAASRLVADRVPGWRGVWEASVQAGAAATSRALTDLATGAGPHLASAAVASAAPRPGPRRYGMCGRLRTWPV
ncbi:cupin domain-containing protein [Actinotalea ferrariae]|uniref:cupin domain-containing protein n=1 Tax=Actinotalea ferrariae TaxID=1386098 RepID=UPI001C8CDE38|nr:cupin domain-containing protein [Actinotalea ferrariae]MBX9243690.1 cupin domain-containing protein [Actinotalea ferrariae]